MSNAEGQPEGQPQQQPEQQQKEQQEQEEKERQKKEHQVAAGDSLAVIVAKLFFVADEAGEPVITQFGHAVTLVWSDGSMATARFEARAGSLGALSAKSATPEENKTRNQRFSEAKKAQEEAKARAVKEQQQPQPA